MLGDYPYTIEQIPSCIYAESVHRKNAMEVVGVLPAHCAQTRVVRANAIDTWRTVYMYAQLARASTQSSWYTAFETDQQQQKLD